MTTQHQPFIPPASISAGGVPGPGPGPGIGQGRLQQRHSGDFRLLAAAGVNGNGSLPVPTGPQARTHSNNMTSVRSGAFDGPRSPSNTKNTAHVPCKFFRQGACQAGKACPFSHSTEPSSEQAPCKYFQKGNCKFGAKCALAHILPDGRRVNRPAFGVGNGHFNQNGRANMHHSSDFPQQNSLLSMQAHMSPTQTTSYPYQVSEELYPAHRAQRSHHEAIPNIDATFSSYPGSAYGSPSDALQPLSPAQKGLTLLEAPLPASFDSQGISHMARYGPIAASVPSRFGLESSPPSSIHARPIGESPALRNLHSSAFGDDGRMGRNGMPSTSPPNSGVDEAMARRRMHMERANRTKMFPASVGARPPVSGDDWDENFAFEEDLVPTALHDLLTPQEKMRRFSRSAVDDETLMNLNQGHTLPSSHRASLSGLGTPLEPSSKVGSPKVGSPGSAPSRFGALFNRAKNATPAEGSESNSLSNHASAFGHVGSPLRNSTLHPDASPSARQPAAPRTSSDGSSFVSSPTRTSSMSMLSQQLQRTRLSTRAAEAAENGAPLQHPGVARVASGGSVGAGISSGALPSSTRLDRVASNSGVSRDRITEEQEQEGLFDMEEEEGIEKRAAKRYSGSWGWGLSGRGSPALGAIGSRLSGGSGAGSTGGGTG